MELYHKLVNDLENPYEFLEMYKKVISEEIGNSSERMKTNKSVGGNSLIQLISTMMILDVGEEGLNLMVDNIKKNELFKNYDPSTIICSSYLYYIIKHGKQWDTRYNQKIYDNILRGFDKINWLLDERAMKILGIKKLSD